MKVFLRYVWVVAVMLFLFSAEGESQTPHYYTTEEYAYRRAQDLYEKEKYAPAQKAFDEIAGQYGRDEDILAAMAEYYAARCAMYLFNEDAEYRLFSFISNHPESALTKEAILDMAFFQYQKKNYRKAVTWFGKVDVSSLPDDRKAEYYFKLGYSLFMRKEYEKAKMAFYEIKDIRSDYTSPAIYYYAHIAYSEGNYETALKEFRRLTGDESFAPIVPYYIVQILYLQKKYDEILDYAPALLEKATPTRADEIRKYIGDAWFRKGNYEKALPYLEEYAKKNKLTRTEHYELGYCYYKTGQYDLAAQEFSYVTGEKDRLSQNTYYLLADCYLHLGDKKNAGFSFSAAAGMDFDPEIKEDALFNYAKLTFELSYSPFNETVRALKEYVDTYPYSSRVNEAYHYLVLAYLNAKNYKLALESLNQIGEKNDEIKKAYQRVAFFRALELLKTGDPDNAVTLLNKSLEYGSYDPVIRARAWFWLGEAWYRLGQNDQALEAFRKFIYSPGAVTLDEYPKAHYNIAYVYFNKKDYRNASIWFRKFLEYKGKTDPSLVADSYNRLADCAFVLRDFQLAIRYYTEAYKAGRVNPDYALYQRGFTYGLVKNPRAKINDLTTLITRYPSSPFVDDALFERGKAWEDVNEPDKALADYRKIINDYPTSSYVPRALLQTGLVSYNRNDYQTAIRNFKKVLEKYPGTPEARYALTGLKNVYVDINDVESYFSYARKLGSFANVDLAEEDSLMYISGENLYMQGNCDKAREVLGKYLKKFPGGTFRVNAHFYLAECARTAGDTSGALDHYRYVIRQPRNLFTESALLASSALLYGRKDYAAALEDYVLLERVAEIEKNILTARLGQLRCSYLMKNYRSVVTVAQEIVGMPNITEEVAREAYYKMAKSYQALGDTDHALEIYRKVAVEVTSSEGAEAKYRVAELLYRQKKNDEAEKVILSFINMSTPHTYWMAKAFLLLADISLDKDDLLQAKYTLQSLIDYYKVEDDGILEEAREKLEAIRSIEKIRNAPDSIEAVPDTLPGQPAEEPEQGAAADDKENTA